MRKILGLTDRLYNAVYKPIANQDVFTILPLLLRPKSRGWVRLKSANPFHYPLINANYFDHPLDIATLVEGKGVFEIFFFCKSPELFENFRRNAGVDRPMKTKIIFF